MTSPAPTRTGDRRGARRTSTDQQDRTGSRWAWLLALPVLCCVGHAALLGLGAGSLATVVGGTTGRVALIAVGVVVVAAAVVLLVRRRSKP